MPVLRIRHLRDDTNKLIDVIVNGKTVVDEPSFEDAECALDVFAHRLEPLRPPHLNNCSLGGGIADESLFLRTIISSVTGDLRGGMVTAQLR